MTPQRSSSDNHISFNVSDIEKYYSGLLKGTIRLFQGLEPMLINRSRAARLVLFEDADVMLNRPTCGARCIIASALHTAFVQLRRGQLGHDVVHSHTTATVITVLTTGREGTAVPADVLSSEIWNTLQNIIYSPESLTWYESFVIAYFGDSREEVLKARRSRSMTNRVVRVPAEATVSGTRGQLDKLSLDVGCYLSSPNAVTVTLKWLLNSAVDFSDGEDCFLRSRVSVPYDVFHVLYHKVGATFGFVQDALLMMLE